MLWCRAHFSASAGRGNAKTGAGYFFQKASRETCFLSTFYRLGRTEVLHDDAVFFLRKPCAKRAFVVITVHFSTRWTFFAGSGYDAWTIGHEADLSSKLRSHCGVVPTIHLRVDGWIPWPAQHSVTLMTCVFAAWRADAMGCVASAAFSAAGSAAFVAGAAFRSCAR